MSVLGFRVHEMFCGAGFRPGRRGPFVPAKGPKTMDAPSGLMGADGRQPEEGGPTRGACPEILWFMSVEGLKHGPPPDEGVPPLNQTAGVGSHGRNFQRDT